MNTNYYEEVKKFIDKEFEEAGRPGHLKHLERTVYWVKKLEEDPSEAILIAAYSHDADHAKRWKNSDPYEPHEVKKKDFTDRVKLREHQERGAEIVKNFLEEKEAPNNLIKKVGKLISRDEFGGNREQDVVKDADSLSFLENNVENFLDYSGNKFRKKDIEEKFDWMYNRISSEEAKEIAKPWYIEAKKNLEKQ